MKLQFKLQPFQTEAVDAVADCFAGQPNTAGISYRTDPEKNKAGQQQTDAFGYQVFKNADLQ
uniref:Uncharacterized protein n=1 Tax=Candidatus Kentrum sp. DK TaxID=2126562 RepID=A0A450THE8_9GAMM|nr:MAG: hypothetical protein BECKDK2373B_GA0170837_10594 [Candidatus Kentron sp. DK]VFJ66648.1 MAG: hypothetical protein BECKDK2373C_GA0170839_11523 [Candidatus Kentron sp. DK]